MKYELSDNEKKNLLEFLDRTELRGREVISFNKIVDALNNPVKQDQEEIGDL